MSKPDPLTPRAATLAHLRHSPRLSVLIIGGGINGIGAFRDLALQGVDVLLVERGDYCSGASAASSHMIHGGLRYLENGEFRLVREAVTERNRLLRNAPHCVRPLPTVIPIFRRFSGLLNAPLKFLRLLNRPAERGALVIKLGLLLYDAYTRDRAVPRHRFQPRRASLRRFPALNPEIRYTATYYDALVEAPERLCLDLLADARGESGEAWAANYLSAAGVHGDTVILRDQLTDEEFTVSPKIVINATGPWIDLTNAGLARPTGMIGGTKGSHLILDHPELWEALDGHEFFFENGDGRIVLICPLGPRVLLGTSDLPVDSPDDAACTDDEIDYFIAMTRRIFPAINVGRKHIVYRFAGVRPLPRVGAGSPRPTPGQISRDHQIIEQPPHADRPFPVLSLVGGKWTTFRAFSEQTADRVLDYLHLPRCVSTADRPIGSAPSGDHSAHSAGSIARYIHAEDAVHLDDILLRRTQLAMQGALTAPLVTEIAGIMAGELGWDTETLQHELARTSEILRTHGVELSL